MNLLALDTSTPRAAVVLAGADGSRLVAPIDPSLRHGRELLPAIRGLLHRAGLAARDLGAIGVGLGPGSYTGLRVGVTAAKTLAYAVGSTLVGLDSLEFFARSAPGDCLRVVALSDAQRGDFHVGTFVRDSPGSPLIRVGPTQILAAGEVFGGGQAGGVESRESRAESRDPDGEGRDRGVEGRGGQGSPGHRGTETIHKSEIPSESRLPTVDSRLRVPPVVVVGPGVERWDRPWPEGVTPIRDAPEPQVLLDMLREALAADRKDDPWFLEPIYLRRSAAEDQWLAKKTS